MKQESLVLDLISGAIAIEDLTEEQRQEAYRQLRPYSQPEKLLAEKEKALRDASQKIIDSAPGRVQMAVQQLVRGEGLYQKYFCNVVELPKVLHAAFIERGEKPVPMQDSYHLPIVSPDGMATVWTKASDKVVAERKEATTKETIQQVEHEACEFYEKAMAKLPEQIKKGNALFKQLDRERKEAVKLESLIDQALASIEAPSFEVKGA